MSAIVQDVLDVPAGYVSMADGMVLVRESSLAGLASLDTIVFDLDGVVLDPTASIMSAHPVSTQLWLEQFRGLENCGGLVTDTDIAAFKLAGGFNDDWNIASAIALFYSVVACYGDLRDGRELLCGSPSLGECAKGCVDYGGGLDGVVAWLRSHTPATAFRDGHTQWDGSQAARLFMEVVSGAFCQEMYGVEAKTFTGTGAIVNDSLLFDVRLLDFPYRQAIYSGRTLGEIHVGCRLTGLDGWLSDDRIISVDDGMPKPHGRPLSILADRLGTQCGAFVGDNPDDFRSVELYRKLDERPFFAIQVLFGSLKQQCRETFIQFGSDMIAPDLRGVADALGEIRAR